MSPALCPKPICQAFLSSRRHAPVRVSQTTLGSPRRAEAEAFIRTTFAAHYGAQVPAFAPNLMLVEDDRGLLAATGWRCAGDEPLYLERYLDTPIEHSISRVAGHEVERTRIVEVGNLASAKAGTSLEVILALARHLDQLGYDWVTFTATRTLVGIFHRLRLPLLALATANPERLGEEASAWGRYYDTAPIVVAGRIRLALEQVRNHG
jgi:hypothetical protein